MADEHAGLVVVSEEVRGKLEVMRNGFLEVHRELLAYERRRYEGIYGRVADGYEFLELVLKDAWFAWLRPMTGLVVEIDEVLAAKKGVPAGEAEALLVAGKELLRADEAGEEFQKNYFRALQEEPEVVAAHARWRRSAG